MINFRRNLSIFFMVWLASCPIESRALVPAGPVSIFAVDALASAQVQAAYAIAQANPGTSSAAVSAALSVGVVDLLAGGAVFGASVAAGYLLVGSVADGWLRLPMTADAQRAPPVPYAAPTVALQPPQTPYTYYGSDMIAQYSADTRPSLWCSKYSYQTTYSCGASSTLGACMTGYITIPSNTYKFCGVANTGTCATGYSDVNGICTLTDARAATADNSLDFTRSGNSISALSAGVDADRSSNKNNYVVMPDGSVTVLSKNNSAQPVKLTVVPRVDGGSTVITNTQIVDASGNTLVQTKTLQVAPSGSVESIGQVTNTGTVSAPVDPVTGSYVPASSVVSVGASPVTNQSITFPNDYARQGEAQASTAPLRDTTVVADPVEPVAADMPTFGNTFTNLLGWRLPAHTSACPSPQIDLSGIFGAGKVWTIDAHCTLVANHTAPIQNAMIVAFTIMALFIVLRA